MLLTFFYHRYGLFPLPQRDADSQLISEIIDPAAGVFFLARRAGCCHRQQPAIFTSRVGSRKKAREAGSLAPAPAAAKLGRLRRREKGRLALTRFGFCHALFAPFARQLLCNAPESIQQRLLVLRSVRAVNKRFFRALDLDRVGEICQKTRNNQASGSRLRGTIEDKDAIEDRDAAPSRTGTTHLLHL